MRHRGHVQEPLPVLLYHRIAADENDPFAVSPALFEQHVNLIQASGRTSLTLGEFAAGLRGEAAMPTRPIVLTFDDGYGETPGVLARLAASGLRSTLYVTTGALDAPGGLSTTGLLALGATDGVELGAHTVSHPYLDAVAPAAAATEIGASRDALEHRLGRPVSTFAYPHGAYQRRVRAAVRAAGFTSAAAVKNAFSHRDDDPLAIARLTCTARTDIAQLARLLAGRGAPLAWRSERLRTRAARTKRRTLHRVLNHPTGA